MLIMVGYPSETDFKKIVTHGLVHNCDITMEQIKDAYDIFGKEIFNIKGKWVRKKPEPVNQNCVAVPKSIATRHKKIILSVDMMYIQNLAMLVTASHVIKFATIANVNTHTAGAIL